LFSAKWLTHRLSDKPLVAPLCRVDRHTFLYRIEDSPPSFGRINTRAHTKLRQPTEAAGGHKHKTASHMGVCIRVFPSKLRVTEKGERS
jgi:hypothetical protein